MTDVHPTAADGFSRGADLYSRGRPDFPAEALQWLQHALGLRPGTTAVDLGAGTGKFTRLMAGTGACIIAIEPVAAMRERLVADLPGVLALDGSAQRIPLPDSSTDAVVCAQSFHWFATHEALAEIHRVLKPGGALGLIWNVRDTRVGWVRQLTNIMEPYEGDAPRYDHGEWRHVFPAPGFDELREQAFPHGHTGPAERVILDRVASVSFIAALPENERARVLERVRVLIAATPELAGRDEVSMPYITRAYCTLKVEGTAATTETFHRHR